MSAFRLSVVASALVLAAVQAHAAGGITPLTSNTSNPSGWRFTPGQSFNGVEGALDGVGRVLWGSFICSGSLLKGGQYVVTAAHCADDFTTMTVDFGVVNDVAAVTRNVVEAYVHPGWNGSLDTGADIAILKLDQKVEGIQGYSLSTTNDIGKDFLMAGYGSTTTGGSNAGAGWNEWGYGHYAYNTFDVDSATFNLAWDAFSGEDNYVAPEHGMTYMADFDPFNVTNPSRYNTLAVTAGLAGGSWTSSAGLGADEGLIAGGDSGGGDFVWNGTEWVLSGVHSWGWNFCNGRVTPSCDYRASNGSSYGDLMGSTAVFSHVEWINSVTAVPEPGTWGLMALGLGLVALRRRQAA